MGDRRHVVAVTGPSASYKTTVCEKLEARGVGDRLRGDGFYGHKPPPTAVFGMRDYESPESVDLQALLAAILALRAGADTVMLPEYNREKHCRSGREVEFRPKSRVILVDSLFALHDPVFAAIDQSFALDIANDLVRTRRRERQGTEYTDDYHRFVMVPSLNVARELWYTRATQVIPLKEETTSDQVAEYLAKLLAERVAA